jgi:four helix bundle protein
MKSISEQKAREIAVECIKFADQLNEQKHYVLARQLVRASTSIGANLMEAKYAESKKDFIHKMKIAEKEACETFYWLEIIQDAIALSPPNNVQQQIQDCRRIIASIVLKAKASLKES